MRSKIESLILLAAILLAAFVPASQAHALGAQPSNRAVVIVSGGAAVSPFTTPKEGCKTGYVAGSTDSYMRDYLISHGYRVFTSPASIGNGSVPTIGDDIIGPYGDCPAALDPFMTVNAVGDIQLAGVSLANFLNFLDKKYHVRQVDLVAHSMGGLFSRSAIKYLQDTKSKIKIRSLTTLGTPWRGAPFANPTDPADQRSGCDGQQDCVDLLKVFGAIAPILLIENRRDQIDALNTFNQGALANIPVTLIAGNAFTKAGGNQSIWPNDGIVNVSSALAQDVPDGVINHRTCYLYEGGTHSVYISKNAKPSRPINMAITWNDTVGNWVDLAIQNSANALKQPNRQNCPAP